MVEKRKRQDSEQETSKSILSATAEIAFPRGGASVLTPLEVKEVANEATQDALFEQSGSSSKSDRLPAKKKSKKNKMEKIFADEPEEKLVTVDSLSFNVLNPGSIVLGKIKQINKMEIILALPDNLDGYIPITNISSELTSRLEEYEDQEEEEDDDDDDGDDLSSDSENLDVKVKSKTISNLKEFPKLSERFDIGQFLRATVVENSKPKFKKRIELSIEPEKVNSSIEELEDLIPNAVVQASVKSVEDHGAILNFGGDFKLFGFISKKELFGKQIAIGSVLLVSITKSNQRTATCKIPSGNVKKQLIVPTISSIDAILPGMLIDALITDNNSNGLVCKAYALCDATINFVHLGVYDAEEIKHKFSIGSKIKARVISSYLKNNEKKLQLSILPSLLSLSTPEENALEAFSVGHIFDSVTVRGKDSNFIFVNVGSGEIPGEAHFSRVSEKADLDMDFKIGSTHKARILGYSTFDNIYILTLDKSKINQPFLRAEDIPVGKTVMCEIKKIITDKGITVKVEDIFEGFVPSNQMSDVKLIYPERKFKIGSKVKGKVLKIINNGSRASIFITLKKSLVNMSDDEVVSSYGDLQIGKRVPATIEKILPTGCVLTFFGFVRAFLPNSEISETFVKNPSDHVKLGQTVKVRITSIDREAKKAQASLRVSGELSETQTKAMDMLVPGRSIVDVQIVEKEKNAVTVELDGNNLRGIIYSGHLSDGNYEQNRAALKKLKVGSTIKALVLSIDSRSRAVFLSAKPSLIIDAKNGTLPTKYKDISVSTSTLHGFVKSVIPTGVFISFGNNLTGLVIPKFASEKRIADLTTAFFPNQSVTCSVITVDDTNKRFLLSLLVDTANDKEPAIDPVDTSVKVLGEYVPGKVTKGTIKSIKNLQINIQLADNQEGRVEVSEIYSDFSSIKDPMKPLAPFKVGQVLDLKVIGYYDNHKGRFSSVNKNKSKNSILELSIKSEDLSASEPVIPISIDDLNEGDEVTGYVSSFGRGFIWICISPSLRAKLSLVDLTNDTSKFDGLENDYPIGKALCVNISSIDKKFNLVTVSTRKDIIKSISDVKIDDVLPAKVMKTKESYVLVSLGRNVSAVSFITDALDNYSDKVDDVYSTGDVVAAKVLEVDIPNNKIFVSLRSESAKDKLINTADDIKRGDIVKGFIKNVANQGLFVALGRNVHALVRVSDLSDSFLKDWKQFYKIHQPVIGKIIKADENGKILMTLKDSEVNGELNYLKRFEDLHVDDIFEGSVRRVTDFGVFVKLDGTLNITGLCHRSQIADSPVENLESIFAEGDRVKIKILAIDSAKKQLSLGMKASYFKEVGNNEDEMINDEDIEMEEASGIESDSEDAFFEDAYAEKSDDESESDEKDTGTSGDKSANLINGISGGLSTGFDWTTSVLEQAKEEESSDEEGEFQNEVNNKKKKKRSKKVDDKTAEINTRAPQSISDFERLLIGNPDSSILWIQYMSFELQLSEVNKAREIAERALKSINYREEQEKLNIWIAFLNLENMFGDEESLEEVFKRACQYMDSYTIHQKLVTIYIASENFEKANELYTIMCKKFGSKQVNLWVSYGSFLLDRGNQEEAHKILAKALQVLSKREHVDVVRKFAQLEFSKGDMEQGRSLFEGLLSDVPKRIDLWNVYIDQELKLGEKKKVEDLFDRVVDKKLTRKQAKFFFGKWLAFEEKENDEKAADYVKAKAAEYAQKLSDRH